MKSATSATYYNGLSVVPTTLTLSIDKSGTALILLTTEGIVSRWELTDSRFEETGDTLIIRNSKCPGKLIAISDPFFSKTLFSIIRNNGRIQHYSLASELGMAKISIFTICILSLLAAGYFFVLPYIAEKSVALLPESVDSYIGDAFLETFLDEHTIDSTKTKYLNEFAAELDLGNSKPIQINVVESDEINAFALPNGQIVIFTGILNDMESPDQLVGLLAHEVSHINLRHSTKMLCRSLAGYLLFSLVFNDNNGIVGVMTENAQELQFLSYSRSFEREADEKGLTTLMKNEIDPTGMVKLFEALETAEDQSLPEILSSHPLTKDRKENMRKIISRTPYEIRENKKLEALFEQLTENDQ
jgi:predicted Zn-dependent protease